MFFFANVFFLNQNFNWNFNFDDFWHQNLWFCLFFNEICDGFWSFLNFLEALNLRRRVFFLEDFWNLNLSFLCCFFNFEISLSLWVFFVFCLRFWSLCYQLCYQLWLFEIWHQFFINDYFLITKLLILLQLNCFHAK